LFPLILFCCVGIFGASYFLSCKGLPPAAANSPEEAGSPQPDEPFADTGEEFPFPEETGIGEVVPEDDLPLEPPPLEIAEDEPPLPEIAEDEPSPEPPPPEIAEDEPSLELPPPAIVEDEPPLEPPPQVIVEDEPLPELPPPPEPAIPPPPPRIVRPAEPVPPPSPARTPGTGGVLPLPVNPIPDLPTRNPPTFTPAPVLTSPEGVSSRIVRAAVGQTIEIPFRLTGWVYLGESASKPGIRYTSKRGDPEGQTFIFQAVLAGAYELKFYRQDFIRDYIINDVVTLIVEEAPAAAPMAAQSFGAPGKAVPDQAPSAGGTASTAVPAQAAPVGTAVVPVSPADPAAAVPETAADGSLSPLPPDTSAEAYLRKAREEYEAGHIPQAIAVLDQFMARFPLGSDEALWLYGQMYETPGSSRNIRGALDCYRRLIQEYPQSNRYADARRRIAYLERYYITIQ
jgi:TolA-binding protein